MIGIPDLCFEACKLMMDNGFLLNPSAFPSVPYNKGGLRVTINNHLSNEDIYEMLTTLSRQLNFMEDLNKISKVEIHKNFALEQ